MNRKEIIGQLEDLLYNFKNFESVETTDDDVVALEFAINELKGTAQEVPVQEQSVELINTNINKDYVNKTIEAIY
ncbi:hypothetical protein [Clostridium perfringens]|uniref:hypothetical protein n=1 Tax=Clostridium perfringens TaxID=1502 RepID=UPI001A232509|nr:hypothetical protein [Clostridium perfringens]WEV22560.1 hypothetical protein PL327_02515 [Clostridium perfringens D]HAT4105998.1 hypothetical protein [Clostridium perfringens]